MCYKSFIGVALALWVRNMHSRRNNLITPFPLQAQEWLRCGHGWLKRAQEAERCLLLDPEE